VRRAVNREGPHVIIERRPGARSPVPRPACPVFREEVATNIDDDRLGRYLAAGALCATPSEAHGILCGLMCGGDADPESTWLQQLLPAPEAGDLQIDEGREALRSWRD
jgi:uncharacterized protein